MALDRYNDVKQNLKQIAINNFIGGIMWGLGATIGLAIILTILTFALKQVNVVPVVGNFAAQVIQYVNQKTPQLKR